MENIVYIKIVDKYEEVMKKGKNTIPLCINKIIYVYKNIFNIITKKIINEENIWILPIQKLNNYNKINNILNKLAMYKNNIYVLSDELLNKDIYKLMNEKEIRHLTGKELKKFLIIKILEYISNIPNEKIDSLEITVLVNDVSEYNIYIIEKLSKIVKSIKIVTSNMYKLKNLEEKLNNEYGIAIQFSNSYRKSLIKSKLIINLDYNNIDINQYNIFEKAIIINTAEDDIKIKSRLFNGIIINSCDIKLKKKTIEKFKELGIYNKYNNLALYQSHIIKQKNVDKIFDEMEEDEIEISALIGNNGNINKKEFKNIFKRLDKTLKTE